MKNMHVCVTGAAWPNVFNIQYVENTGVQREPRRVTVSALTHSHTHTHRCTLKTQNALPCGQEGRITVNLSPLNYLFTHTHTRCTSHSEAGQKGISPKWNRLCYSLTVRIKGAQRQRRRECRLWSTFLWYYDRKGRESRQRYGYIYG